MPDLVSCPRCEQDVSLTGFGRCAICGDLLSDATPKQRVSIAGFSNPLAGIGMLIGVVLTLVFVLTSSLLGLFFTLPLCSAALRFRHQSL